jgi:outer membrane protein TolC
MRRFIFRSAAALAFAAILIPGAFAQTAQVQAAPPQTQATQTQPAAAPDATTLVPPVRPFRLPSRIGVFGDAQLTLQQVLAMALANNKDITASRIDREIAGYSLTGARGLYDPTVGAVSQFLKQTNPVASSLGGSTTGAVLNRTWQSDPTLSGSTPWLGGSYHVDFLSQRVYTNNSFATLNPQFPAALVFQYTQPLLRNLRYDQNRLNIDVAKKNLALSNEQFRQRVMLVVEQTEQAYWELFYAYNNLQVQLDSVEIARMQDESNRRQQAQGLLAPIDVVAAQTQLANFELNAYSAQSALTQAENNLKTLMLEGRSSALWNSALIPVTSPEAAAPVTPLADALNQALAGRPEVAEVQINGEINQRDTRYYRDQTKPQVDLVTSYTRNGLAGPQITQSGVSPFTASFAPLVDRLNILSADAGLPPINLSSSNVSTTPALLIGGYGQSLNNLWSGDFPTTQIQLRVSLPIRNRVAEANLSTSVAQGRRIQNQREQITQSIEADVRNTMQLMQSAELRLGAARVQRESAEEQYNSEQRQFRAGTSTLFLVQQRQTTMITARSQERRAQSDLGEAISAFELATASILRQHSINLQ